MAKHKPYPLSKVDALNKFCVALNKGEMKPEDELTVWRLMDGSTVFIKDLRDSHLIKIVAMFVKNQGWRKHQQGLIYAEIERRKRNKLMKVSEAARILYANGRNAKTDSN